MFSVNIFKLIYCSVIYKHYNVINVNNLNINTNVNVKNFFRLLLAVQMNFDVL